MANNWGYAVQQTDRPGLWIAGGEVTVDGYGTASYAQVPSAVVSSIVHTATGKYTINLTQSWYAAVDVHVQTVLPLGSSPACLIAQIQSVTVSSSTPKITFEIFNPSTEAAAELPSGGGFNFLLVLQQTSF